MPRLNIRLHAIDDLADLEDQEEWEELLSGEYGSRRDGGLSSEQVRTSRGFREQRYGGSEAVDRKRAERRKHSTRSGRTS